MERATVALISYNCPNLLSSNRLPSAKHLPVSAYNDHIPVPMGLAALPPQKKSAATWVVLRNTGLCVWLLPDLAMAAGCNGLKDQLAASSIPTLNLACVTGSKSLCR